MIKHVGVKQLVQNATHISGSLLDHVYTNTSVRVWQTTAYYSDHDILWIKL